MKSVNKFYSRYEYLVKEYASKIEITDKSIEHCDMEQELRLKLYTSIIAYGKRWKNYKLTGKLKPIPLEYFLKTALNNRLIDIYKASRRIDTSHVICCDACGSSDVKKTGVKRMQESKQKVFTYNCNLCTNDFVPTPSKHEFITKEQDKLDIGYTPVISNMDLGKKVLIIEGHDFLEGLFPMEKACICMFFKGYERPKLAKIFKHHFEGGYNGVLHFIDNQLEAYRNSQEIKEILADLSGDTKITYMKSIFDEE